MIVRFIKKRLSIILVAVAVILITGSVALAANLISKTLTGGIEVVTSSGGGGGGMVAPDPADITILNVLDFGSVPTQSTSDISGQIEIQNNTGSDLYWVSAEATVNSSLGSLAVTGNVTGEVILSGATEVVTVVYSPVGGGMPLGNWIYEIELGFSY